MAFLIETNGRSVGPAAVASADSQGNDLNIAEQHTAWLGCSYTIFYFYYFYFIFFFLP